MTDQQEAVLRALEQGVSGMPDARPVSVEAKDIRALTTLARGQQSDLTTLQTQLAEAREQLARLQPARDVRPADTDA